MIIFIINETQDHVIHILKINIFYVKKTRKITGFHLRHYIAKIAIQRLCQCVKLNSVKRFKSDDNNNNPMKRKII